MKPIFSLLLVGAGFATHAQNAITSGTYDEQLHLAFNPATNVVTGYFESYTGLDEQTGNPRFSCIFYIEGKLKGKTALLKTYYPADSANDVINGTLQLKSTKQLTIQLPEEHGGCWNVQHFADGPTDFSLSEKKTWVELRYVTTAKSYFYTSAKDGTQRKAFIVKGDVLHIERFSGGWAYGTYLGKTATKGWVKTNTLNALP